MIDWLLFPLKTRFSRDKQFYKLSKDIFGICPNNIELYKLALIHKSASIVFDNRTINNERLEFLGDAVIETIVSDMLFIEFPDEDEGFLTQLRSKIVSRASLNQLARRLGIDEYLISQNNYHQNTKKNIYGDALEALMGALYLDQGYNTANRLFINNIIHRYVDLESLLEMETDFKSRLIEWCQQHHRQVLFENVPNTDPSATEQQFSSIVFIDNHPQGYGIGDSKKEAEQRSAKNALGKMKLLNKLQARRR